MGRTFAVDHQGRRLAIRVLPVDEGWDFWVCEGDARLVLGGSLTIDEVVEGYRRAEDRVQDLADSIHRSIATGALTVPPLAPPPVASGDSSSANA
jgi:hypothetical protein